MRCVVRPALLDVTLFITNRWEQSATIAFAWELSADYASVDEAQFGIREQNAEVITQPVDNGVMFRYTHPRLRPR